MTEADSVHSTPPLNTSASNIIDFRSASARRVSVRTEPAATRAPDSVAEPWRQRPNMHTHLFRSYSLIVESAEADLLRDVRLDVDKAQSKLKRIRQQLKRDAERAAARLVLLTSADKKLSAAIASARRPSED